LKKSKIKKLKKLVGLYLKCAKVLNFSAHELPEVEFSENGLPLLEAFAEFDDNGNLKPTRNCKALQLALYGKACLNFHIQLWAEGIEVGIIELMENFPWLPDWVFEAVIAQQKKLWEKKFGHSDINPAENVQFCRDYIIKGDEYEKISNEETQR